MGRVKSGPCHALRLHSSTVPSQKTRGLSAIEHPARSPQYQGGGGRYTGLYIIIIMFAILGRSFWLLVFLTVLFGWPALVGVVRAEFLRARNFEYVRAAKALGVSDRKIMFRHMLPNAMVATLTMMPFIITATIASLASLDFLGFGLPSSAPSLGELTLQAKQNLQAPWLGFTAFITFALMLSLLVFIFEGVRDAFDPRKTFA